jgi:hypothetical protein
MSSVPASTKGLPWPEVWQSASQPTLALKQPLAAEVVQQRMSLSLLALRSVLVPELRRVVVPELTWPGTLSWDSHSELPALSSPLISMLAFREGLAATSASVASVMKYSPTEYLTV